MRIQQIDVADIVEPPRLREVDDAWVEVLTESIRREGLQTPIQIRINQRDGGYWLIAGGHRLAAVQSLKLKTIPAIVVDADQIKARALEIVENLYRRELNPLDMAASLAELKDIYENENPDSQNGGDRGNQHSSGKKRQNDIMSFCQNTEEKTGYSKRSIERAVRRWNGLSPASRDCIKGTWIAENGAAQGKLAALPHESQALALGILLDQTRAKPVRQVGLALEIATGVVDEQMIGARVEPYEKVLNAFWSLNTRQRTLLLQELEEQGIIHPMSDEDARVED